MTPIRSNWESRAVIVAGLGLAILLHGCAPAQPPGPAPPRQVPAMPFLQVSADGRGFTFSNNGDRFVPWGFNYDHDHDQARLIEDYWHEEWATVAGDFREMKALGANVARVHLQFGKFMRSAHEPDARNLAQLRRLLRLAEDTGLYLNLTGLGCYHQADVPAWYDALEETGRWEAQARFWEEVARVCAPSPAVFCYDLMNEPVSPAGRGAPGAWLGPPLAGKHFVQYISLDSAGRERAEIGRLWVARLLRAIRRHDRRHLVTVGLVDWSLERPGLTSGMEPAKVGAELDFISVHLYPRAGGLAEDVATLKGFAAIGKPVVIEETFPLQCPVPEFARFIDASRAHAGGWFLFYWGKTIEELGSQPKTLGDALLKASLEFFRDQRPPETGRRRQP